MRRFHRHTPLMLLAITLMLPPPAGSASRTAAVSRTAASPLGSTIVLSWNDLGMHCMNQYHGDMEVLPPFNTLRAQVIRRGDGMNRPVLLSDSLTSSTRSPGTPPR